VDDDSMRKATSTLSLNNGRANPAYSWNSLPSVKEDSKPLRRDIPRPSVIGSTSTISYYNKAFNRGTYIEGELESLPGKVTTFNFINNICSIKFKFFDIIVFCVLFSSFRSCP